MLPLSEYDTRALHVALEHEDPQPRAARSDYP